MRELAEIRAMNFPRNPGDVLGVLQWADTYDGKIRRWTVRIGDRRDQITLSANGGTTKSMGWSSALVLLRKKLANK